MLKKYTQQRSEGMFGISMSSISMIVGLISLGIVCLAAFFNYTRNFDVSKRIRRIEKYLVTSVFRSSGPEGASL